MIYLNDDIAGFDFDAALPLLSEQRREQALKFKYELGRKTCAMAYLLLCEGLQKEYGLTERPVFEYGEHGKPAIIGHPDIHFNLSHCREAVICAVSNRPVGIDNHHQKNQSGETDIPVRQREEIGGDKELRR